MMQRRPEFGLATIDGKQIRMEYPFPHKYHKQGSRPTREGVIELVIEEYTLVSVAPAKKLEYDDGYKITYPKAKYRFDRYVEE